MTERFITKKVIAIVVLEVRVSLVMVRFRLNYLFFYQIFPLIRLLLSLTSLITQSTGKPKKKSSLFTKS